MPSAAIETQNPRPPLPPLPPQDLSVLPSDLNTAHASAVPFVDTSTPLSAAFRFVEPTWRNYIAYVGMEARSGNTGAARYVKCWEALDGRERMVYRPEQLCELAGVSAADLLSWVTRQAWLECSAKVGLCLSFMRDKVMEQTARFAMESPDNYKHAELFAKTSGMLPQPSGRSGGVTIPIFNGVVSMGLADARQMPSSGSVVLPGGKTETGPALTAATGLRSMDEDIVDLAKIMQTDAAIPSIPGIPGIPGSRVQDEDEDKDEDDEDEDEDEDEE